MREIKFKCFSKTFNKIEEYILGKPLPELAFYECYMKRDKHTIRFFSLKTLVELGVKL